MSTGSTSSVGDHAGAAAGARHTPAAPGRRGSASRPARRECTTAGTSLPPTTNAHGDSIGVRQRTATSGVSAKARRSDMSTTAGYMSAYDLRVELVKDTVRKHSKLSEKASHELAEQILDVLNHIPEKVR
jgi:hypothetical protein